MRIELTNPFLLSLADASLQSFFLEVCKLAVVSLNFPSLIRDLTLKFGELFDEDFGLVFDADYFHYGFLLCRINQESDEFFPVAKFYVESSPLD